MNVPNSPVLETLPLERHGVLCPPEVLARIFSMILGSYALHYTKEIGEDLKKGSRTILAASQVCQVWREVTLGPWCAHIWGMIINVDFNSTSWVKELIRRSGSAPLFVQSNPIMCTSHRSFASEKWQAIFDEIHRFKKLDLTIGRDDMCDILPFLLRPAPLLETFSLRSLREYFFIPGMPFHLRILMNEALKTFELPLGAHLFNNDSPKLRTGKVTLDNFLFHSFTTGRDNFPPLNIVRLQLSLTQQLSFLGTSPISLSSVGPSTKPIISLPDLEELVLSVSEKWARLLSRLVIPYTCMVTLSLSHWQPPHPGLASTSPVNYLLPWLGAYFRGWSSQSPVHFFSLATGAGRGGFAFHAGTKEDPLDRPRFVLEYNAGANTKSAFDRFLNFLLEEQIVNDAVALKLDFLVLDPVCRQSLHNLLSVCNFSTLTLLPLSLKNILPSLLTQYPHTTTKNLSHLIIDGLQLDRQWMVDSRDLVAEYLFQRFTEKMSLPKLTIHVCSTTEFFAWNSEDAVFFAKEVSNLMRKSAAVRRGELSSQGCWSLEDIYLSSARSDSDR